MMTHIIRRRWVVLFVLVGFWAVGRTARLPAVENEAGEGRPVIGCDVPGPRSVTFRVAVAGTVVPVVRFGDIDYVHFACPRPVSVEVQRLDGIGVDTCCVRPKRFGIATHRDAKSVRFSVTPGQKLVVNVDLLRKLFVFAEPVKPDDTAVPQLGWVNVIQCGADPSGATDSTEAIQAAIDGLPADGTLYLPPGVYRSGSLRLKSRMTLHLAAGALLKGSDDYRKFKRHRDSSYLYFLLADGLENVSIAGQGTIDGNGYVVRRRWEEELDIRKQSGRLLLCVDCRNIEVRDVVLRDSYSWTAHLVHCAGSRLVNLKIMADTRLSNGDGLDVDGCRSVIAEDLFIYAEDDAISVKAAWTRDSPEDLTFRNCVLWSQNATGVRLGTETRSEAFGGLRFETLSILRANTMIRIFCYDGADIHDVLFRDIDTEEISLNVQPGYDEYQRNGEPTKGESYLLQLQVRKRKNVPLGKIRDVVFENINARTAAGSKIKGYDAPEGATVIRNVTFRNVRVEGRPIPDSAAGRFSIGEHVQDVRFETTGGY